MAEKETPARHLFAAMNGRCPDGINAVLPSKTANRKIFFKIYLTYQIYSSTFAPYFTQT
jgi:hypothetical protein